MLKYTKNIFPFCVLHLNFKQSVVGVIMLDSNTPHQDLTFAKAESGKHGSQSFAHHFTLFVISLIIHNIIPTIPL